jgi:hypothetical protein
MIEKLMPLSYLLEDDSGHNIIVLDLTSWGEKTSWAIRSITGCLNKNGEWEYEPSPSNRDEEFLKRCRWDSAEEALEFWNNHSK